MFSECSEPVYDPMCGQKRLPEMRMKPQGQAFRSVKVGCIVALHKGKVNLFSGKEVSYFASQ